NEKSWREVKAMKVSPPNSRPVTIPAVGMTLGELKYAAMYSNGKKITASATTYSARPAYCICGEAPERAHFSANHDTPIKAANTTSQEYPPSITRTSPCAPDHWSNRASTPMKPSTAQAR